MRWRPGTEQVTRFAAELALSRGGELTVSAKTNMLPATDRWFCDIAREVAAVALAVFCRNCLACAYGRFFWLLASCVQMYDKRR